MDRLEIEQLYERHGYYLYRRCRQFLQSDDDAYDALQEVFLRCVAHRRRLVDGPALLPWLNRVTTHYCLNVLRQRGNRRTEPVATVDGLPGTQVELFDILSENTELVKRVLVHSRPAERDVAVTYFLDDRSLSETAAAHGLSVPTVRRRLKAFLKRARRLLSEGGRASVRTA